MGGGGSCGVIEAVIRIVSVPVTVRCMSVGDVCGGRGGSIKELAALERDAALGVLVVILLVRADDGWR